MLHLDDLRTQWIGLGPKYEQFGGHVAAQTRQRLKRVGILAAVLSRAKSMDSLLKKAIRKGYSDPLEEMHDKAGVRIIVPFISRLQPVDAIVRDAFDVRAFENKQEGLGKDKFAYQSWHYDIQLREPVEKGLEEFRGWWCEIQLRTECQHLWAEMAHRLLYKSEQEFPEAEARRVHRLNALLEISDHEFENTRTALASLPGAWAVSVLSGLEGIYYELTGRDFDRELSLEVLECLRPLCPPEPAAAVDEVREWVDAHRASVEAVISAYSANPDRILFLFQPEGVLLLTRLDRNRFTLRERWGARFPEEELRRLATALALPFD